MLYVTERCVFRSTVDGLELIEVAPGIDVDRDILAHMGFEPIVRNVQLMDPRIFRAKPMGLASVLLDLRLSDRVSYDADRNVLFANFEGYAVRNVDDIESVRRVFEALCGRIGRKVDFVANYDDFVIDDWVADAYFDMVAGLHAKYYATATRYTTSAFMRMKLGSLVVRDAGSQVFESRAEAHAFLAKGNVGVTGGPG